MVATLRWAAVTDGEFEQGYKREEPTDPDLADALQLVFELLAADAALPVRLADHGLSGAWTGFRDCHISLIWGGL